ARTTIEGLEGGDCRSVQGQIARGVRSINGRGGGEADIERDDRIGRDAQIDRCGVGGVAGRVEFEIAIDASGDGDRGYVTASCFFDDDDRGIVDIVERN